MDSREEKLPVWAKDLLADMRRKIATATEPLLKELNTLRPRMEILKSRNEAMIELIECAAKGGHPTSIEIAKMIEAYGLDKSEATAEQLAEKFHCTYEKLAPDYGYETRKDSAVPWESVPEKNKRLMIAVCGEILVEKLF